jgi:hypothetical protein
VFAASSSVAGLLIQASRTEQVLAARAKALTAAHARNPTRFVNKHPAPPAPRTEAWINKPATDEEAANSAQPTNSTNN